MESVSLEMKFSLQMMVATTGKLTTRLTMVLDNSSWCTCMHFQQCQLIHVCFLFLTGGAVGSVAQSSTAGEKALVNPSKWL